MKGLQNGGISFVAWTSRPLLIANFYPKIIKQRSLQRLHTKIVVAIEDRDEGRTL